MTRLRKISVKYLFQLAPHILLFSLIIYILFYFYIRGFIPHDEGWIISPAERITQGDLPYRDFHYLYLPGVAYVVAFGFKLFGVSILVSRIVSMIFALIAIYCLFQISRIISKNTYAYLIPVSIFIAWGPSHLNFAHPTMFAVFGGIVTSLLLYLYRKRPIFLLFAGLTTGLTFLFKQNFGIALLINNFIFFILEDKVRNKKFISQHILGIILFPGIMLIYFFFTNSFIPFFQDMYFFMIQEMIEKGVQATPFIYPDIWYKEIAKTLFYISPLLISIPAIYLSYKRNKKILFFATFSALYYLIGIRPTTDYVHVVGLLSLTGIPLLMIISLTKNKYSKIVSYMVALGFLVLGVYTALFMNYYRWNTPLIAQNTYTADQRLGILTDLGTHIAVSELQDYFSKHPTRNDYMFVDSFAPSFYV
jgi:4-amino-4-deoxy-L-arabinose transferase-like glycosyltransferase